MSNDPHPVFARAERIAREYVVGLGREACVAEEIANKLHALFQSKAAKAMAGAAHVHLCGICTQPLDVEGDESTRDCGGDCLRCMAEIGEDPDCIRGMIAAGFPTKRDGTPFVVDEG